MVFCPENAAHYGRTLIDSPVRLRPPRRLNPVVMVFPAGSLGVRTPGAPDVETVVATPTFERPIQIEAAFSPLNRPREGQRVGCRAQRQPGVRENKGVFFRCWILRYERRVEASKGPCTR
jgi:hypothetical protein